MLIKIFYMDVHCDLQKPATIFVYNSRVYLLKYFFIVENSKIVYSCAPKLVFLIGRICSQTTHECISLLYDYL